MFDKSSNILFFSSLSKSEDIFLSIELSLFFLSSFKRYFSDSIVFLKLFDLLLYLLLLVISGVFAFVLVLFFKSLMTSLFLLLVIVPPPKLTFIFSIAS